MSGLRFALPFVQWSSPAGSPYPGAKLYFYESGTSTKLATYSESSLTVPNTNPVVADGNGTFPTIFLSQNTAYKVILKTSRETQIWSADPVETGLASVVYIQQVQLSDPSGSAITTGDGVLPYRINALLGGYNLTAVAASVETVSSSGIVTIQVRRVRSGSATDMLSTKLTIDANEKDSSTATTAVVIDTSNDDVLTADHIYADIDVAGTGAKGLLIQYTFTSP